MDIQLSAENLSTALGYVIGVIEKRSTLPILGNILLRAEHDHLHIVGTDLEVEIESHLAGHIDGSGLCTLPARKLHDICRVLPGDKPISIRITGDSATVVADRTRYRLAILPAADFPRIDTHDRSVAFEMSAEELKEILEKTAFAMAQQDVRYYLNGLFFAVRSSDIVAVATDGHRLAKYQVDCQTSLDEEKHLIVPGKAIYELRRILGAIDQNTRVRVELSDTTIYIATERVEFLSKLVDGKFPNYERVIPIGLSKTARVSKDELRDALMRTALISNEKHRGVQLVFDANHLKLLARNQEQETAEEDLGIDYEGEYTSIGFNIAYIMDVLQAIQDKSIQIEFEDAGKTTIWRGSESDRETFIIMPMRL